MRPDAEVEVSPSNRDQESPSSRRAHQRPNWDAEERAVRAADTQAAADHLLREREREAAKREAVIKIHFCEVRR